MKNSKFLLMLVAALMALTFAACGDDEPDNPVRPNDPDNTEAEIYGTWRGVRTEGQGEYISTITFNRNNSLSGKWIESDGDVSDFKGSFTLTDNVLDVVLVYITDGEYDETEEHTFRIINLTSDTLEALMIEADANGNEYKELYRFKR